MSNVPYVLLSGAGLGSWIWESLRGELPHSVAYEADAEAPSLSARVEGLEAWIRQRFDQPVVLVAHSAGSLLALELVGRAPELVEATVYLGSYLPTPGQSFVACLPLLPRLLLPLVLRLAGTLPPEADLRASLCPGLTPTDEARIVAEHRREHVSLFLDRLVRPAHPEKRLYVVLTEDKAVPPAWQRRQVRHWSPAEVTTLASGHLPMLTQAAVLAKVLRVIPPALVLL